MIFSAISLTAQTQNYLTVSGNKLYDSTGKEVRLTGVNWFGFETQLKSPHGIWKRDMKSVLQQIKDLGFNTIRVPWCNEMLDPGASVNVPSYGADPYTGISPMNEEETTVSTPIELMDIFVNWCQENDMKIVLDNHSRAADGFLNEAYWYTDEYSEERWINDWVFIANRYKGISAVVAMDLNNEPHGSTWGDSNLATDWNKAAERCGNAILEVNPDVVIIVEGVGEFEGNSYWWGGQLMGAADYPVVLSNPEKLMYSAHEYGPEVAPQDWFTESDFPNNMPAIWLENYDYLYQNNTSPIFVGEFGIKDQNAFGGISYTWFTEFMDFMGSRYSWTFWTMNPNSGDTGGILQDDWTSVNQWKMDVLIPHFDDFIPNVIGDEQTNNPPVASFIGFNEPCGEDPRIAFLNASSSSDPDGDTLTYSWDFGDGTTGTGEILTHNYSNFPGDIATVTLTVSDGELSDSLTRDVELFAGACVPPTIDTLEIQASTISGNAPLTVDLEAIVTMLSGTVDDVNFSWDFDNGTFSSGRETSVTYSASDEYTIVVTAETITNTVTASINITVSEVESELSLNYRNGGNSTTDNSINPHFVIVNNGSNAVDYSDLSIRYWFTSEDNSNLNFWCDWAQLGTADVQGSFGQANRMDYLEITFTSSSSISGNGNSGPIQTRLAKTNWSNFNENDDYSFDATKTAFAAHEQVTLYQNGALVWGAEPNGTASTTSSVLFTTYPNPATERIIIENNSSLEGAMITLTDFSGRPVKSISPDIDSNTFNVDLLGVNSGIYIVKITTEKGTHSDVIIVK